MKQFIKDCESYDSCLSSIFHIFLQCLLYAEMSQIRVYFLQIGFVTPAKKRSPWSEKIIFCISTSTIAVSYFFRYHKNNIS